jgi:hypothetical protein
MLIATGFEFDTFSNNFFVQCVTESGIPSLISREKLHQHGLPYVDSPTVSKRIITDFKDWREVNLREYLTPLKIELPVSKEIHHQCYSFVIHQKTYLLPALVLMRGIFFPANVLLPTMFLPNALDVACNFGWQKEGLTVELELSWLLRTKAHRAKHLTKLLTWLYAYPSAFKTASSLHANAVRGLIRIELPLAMVTLALQSVSVGNLRLVTKVYLVNVLPLESPQFQLETELKTILLRSTKYRADVTRPVFSNLFEVPLRADGGYCLNDAEWDSIRNLTKFKTGVTKHDIRLLLDGVLTKLVTKVPWKKIDYKVGTWINASALLRVWSQDGRFEKLIAELGRLRCSTALVQVVGVKKLSKKSNMAYDN